MNAVIKIRKPGSTELLLFLTVLALQNFALLVPAQDYLVPGLLKFSDIGTVMGLLFLIWCYTGVQSRRKVHYQYGFSVIFFLLLQLISALTAFCHFEQPVAYGIRAMRNIMVCFLLYFPVTRVLQLGILKRRQLVNILFFVGTLELLLYTAQFLLAGVTQIIHVDTDELRFGSARLRVPYLLPMMLGLMCYDQVLRNKAGSALQAGKNLLFLAWSVFLLAGICKHRAPALILICTLILGYVLWRRAVSTKILIGSLILIIGIASFFNSSLILSVLDALSSGSENTLLIRSQGQQYYLEQLRQSWLFGFGYPNADWNPATEASGVLYLYFLADNGVLGFFYIYGLVGMIWLGQLFIRLIKGSWNLYRTSNCYFFLLYFIFETANLYIGMHWYYYYFLPFVMVIILLDYDTHCIKTYGRILDQ